MSQLALIGLGSNVGDRKKHLDSAVAALNETSGIAVRAVSSYHETAPVGGPSGQGLYLNAAAALETTLPPLELLRTLHATEAQEGRIRAVAWGERTLDLDLLTFGDQVIDTPGLEVPHPRMALRRFVLSPLVEIAPTVLDPLTGKSMAQLLANLDRRPSYVALFDWSDVGRAHSAVFDRIVEKLQAASVRDAMTEEKESPQMTALLEQEPEELLARRFEQLRADRWMHLGERWLASDFYFLTTGLPAMRLALNDQGRWKAFLKRMRQANREVLSPTFLVLPSIEGRIKHPLALKSFVFGTEDHKFFDSPILWPKSVDPDAIAAEVVATCTASRTG